MKKSIALFFALSLSVNLAFADSIADTSNYLPGGPYRLFGSGRGSIDNINNYIRVGGGLSQKVGNLSIETTTYKGGVSYTQEFHNHGWQVHSPFANTAKQEFHSKNGKIVNGGGATLTDLSVTGYEIHPADGYDGEQGGGYPTPTGARDEYAYLVNGKEVSVRIVDLDKLPPKANDDKVLRNVGIDPTPYNQTNINDRPTFEKLTLVGANDSGGLTGYNGGAENGSADTSTNGNGWNSAETNSPISLYEGQHDSNPYGIQPYHLSPASLAADGNAAGEYNPTDFQRARDEFLNSSCKGGACISKGANAIWQASTEVMPTAKAVDSAANNVANGDYGNVATDLALSRTPMKGVGKNVKNVVNKANDAKNTGKNVAKNTPTTSGGTANSATYPKLKQDLAQQNLNNIAKQDTRLNSAVNDWKNMQPNKKGEINFGVGSANSSEAEKLGKIWVGDGAKSVNSSSCVGCWLSADGTRLYRPPTQKPNTPSHLNPTGTQANFVTRDPNTGKTIANGHLNIK